MKKANILLMTVAAISLLQINSSFAGTIKVINENQKELEVIIQAEGDALTEKLPSYVQRIPAEHYTTFTIDLKKLKSKSHYSISGKTNPIMGDTCQHLSVGKDYQITFENDTIGTTCLAEEISKNPKPSKGAKKKEK